MFDVRITKRLAIVSLLIVSVLLHNVALSAAQTTVTMYPAEDYYADSKYPKSAYGKTSFLYAGNSYDRSQNIWGSEWIFIRFDLTRITVYYLGESDLHGKRIPSFSRNVHM